MKYTSKLILNWTEYEFGAGGGWWQPWANTIAYYPLVTNANDTTSNHNDMTADALITFSSDWAYLPSGTGNSFEWLLEPNTVSIPSTWTYTILWWQKTLWVVSGDARWLDLQYSSWSNNRLFTAWNTNGNYNFHNTSGGVLTATENANTRYLNAITINNWVVEAYVNGTKLTGSLTLNTSVSYSFLRWWQEGSLWANRALHWYLKDIIIEDKCWTVQEVSDYFNQTKSLYWIS